MLKPTKYVHIFPSYVLHTVEITEGLLPGNEWEGYRIFLRKDLYRYPTMEEYEEYSGNTIEYQYRKYSDGRQYITTSDVRGYHIDSLSSNQMIRCTTGDIYSVVEYHLAQYGYIQDYKRPSSATFGYCNIEFDHFNDRDTPLQLIEYQKTALLKQERALL